MTSLVVYLSLFITTNKNFSFYTPAHFDDQSTIKTESVDFSDLKNIGRHVEVVE